MKTSLIIPAYNEKEALPLTIDEYIDYADEIVVVDDGSKDGTDVIAQEYMKKYAKIRYVRHPKNMGKPEALKTGVKCATGDCIVFTDADCTYPARYIPQFIGAIYGGADMVLGARQFNGGNIRMLNRFGNGIFSTLITLFCYSRVSDAQTGFRAMRRDIFTRLDVPARNLEYETKMTMRAVKLGYNVMEIPIEYRKRVGRSKLNPVKDGFNMLRSIYSIVWDESTGLMRGIILVNVLMFALGILFGLYSLYEKLAFGALSHEYYPLLAMLLIFASIQLMGFSIMIEYVVNKLDKLESAIKRSGPEHRGQ